MDDRKSTSSYVFLLKNGASTRIARRKLILLCHQQKFKIWQLHKQLHKQCGFHQFLGTLVFYIWNPLSFMVTIEVIYFYQRTQSFMLSWNISLFIIIWCKRRLKEALLSWCIAMWRIQLQLFWPRNFLLTSMNISNIWWVWVKCVTFKFVEWRCWISTSYQIT